MKKLFYLTLTISCFHFSYSQTTNDSIYIKQKLEQITIDALRVNERTPMTYTNISNIKIEKQNLGQDLPYLLQNTPSLVTTSDAGAGIGYSGLRIRGSDQTRINVTLNGIPINDSESQGVWWVNMPDLSSSIDNIQIQRGVGSSTNGASAFGATINLKTNKLNKTPYAISSNTIGSYETLKNNLEFGTGLMNDKFSIDGRLSRISSEGYIDRATSDLKSFYLSASYFGKKDVLKGIIFSGKEVTYQAWNGVPKQYLDDKLLRTYNLYTYKNEIDDYGQTHYQIHYSNQINNNSNYNFALHYTKGNGYYEQFKSKEQLVDYGLTNLIIGDSTISTSDLIRRKWLDNDFYGSVFSYIKRFKNINITLGGAWNIYEGIHFGTIIWSEYASNSSINHQYYNNAAKKIDRNAYVKLLYSVNEKLNLYADFQKRLIDYKFIGLDTEYNNVQQSVNFDFFNPKFGLHYQINDKQSAYTSFSVANKEPNRNDFVESTINSRPLHETLYDTELGYKFKAKKIHFFINAYYMIYNNQLVLTGQINDVGAYTRKNINYSERKGIEIQGFIKLNNKLNWAGNVTISKNKIPYFVEYVDNWNTWSQERIEHNNTDISFSPKLIWGSSINYNLNNSLSIELLSKYVGNQYIDNTSSNERMLRSYLIHNSRIDWNIKSQIFKSIKLSFQINNIFNKKYENNAWVYHFLSTEDPTQDPYVNKQVDGNYNMIGYFPQALRNYLLALTIAL